MNNRILYVKPCWGVFRDGAPQPRGAYPSSASAIRHALQGAAGSVEIVVLDEDGKVAERLTRASRQAGAAELGVTDNMVERAARTLQRCFEETGDGSDLRAWDEIDVEARAGFRADARAALEAALR